jgi:signal transduction histidine kinase
MAYIDQLIGTSLLSTGRTEEALKVLNDGLKIAMDINAIDEQRQYYESISNAFAKLGDYRNAYENYKRSTALGDSILTKEKQDELLRLQTQFETSQKEKEIALLNKDKQLKEAEASQQRQLKNVFIIGAVFLLLIALVLMNRYQLKKRTAGELAEKNKIIEKEKKRAEESEQFKSQFLANMSHEIRTPMNAVMGMTNLLLEEPQNEKNFHYLKTIQNASNNLLVVINDVLDLSKIEAGKMELEEIPFRLSEVVESVIDTMKLKADEKGLKLIAEMDEAVPPILFGDPARLTQVLLNLMGNAVKFTDRGSVELRVEKIGRRDNNAILHSPIVSLQFSVIDTGIGIEKGKLEKYLKALTRQALPIQGNMVAPDWD